MPIQVTGNSSFLWSTQPATGVIRLQAGETVRAFVRNVTDQEVLLLIRGQQIQARTDTRLQPGQQVTLRVQELLEGRVVFQVIQEETAQGQLGATRSTPAEALLARQGLQATPGNLLLAQALLDSGKGDIPREQLLLLSRFMGTDPSPTRVLALIQLVSKGLPLTNSPLAAMESFTEVFAGKNSQNTGLALLASLPGGGELAEGLSVVFGEGSKQIAAKLAQVQEKLGIRHEALLRESMETLLKNPGRSAGAPEGSQAVAKNTTVKELLLNLLNTAQALEINQSPENLQAARTLLQVLTGLQLLHLGQGEQGQLYLMGWLQWPGGLEENPFFLSFFQDEQGGRGPGEPSRQVMLKTFTPRLGSILADMRFFGRHLTIQVAVENATAQKAFNRYTAQLLTMMEGLPWQVQVLPCRLMEEKKTGQWLREYVEPVTSQRLDVRL